MWEGSERFSIFQFSVCKTETLAGHWPSVIAHRSLTTHPLATACGSRLVLFQSINLLPPLPRVVCSFSTVSGGLRYASTTGYYLAAFQAEITDYYLLLTARCPLLITRCPLPTAHCPLLTSHSCEIDEATFRFS
jgi:hypothetical protein